LNVATELKSRCTLCILKYVYDVVVKKFTFAISSPDEFLVILAITLANVVKGKGFPYSLPRVGPGADLGVQAFSPQVIHPAVGCHYLPPGLRLPSQLQKITAPWPGPSYTVW